MIMKILIIDRDFWFASRLKSDLGKALSALSDQTTIDIVQNSHFSFANLNKPYQFIFIYIDQYTLKGIALAQKFKEKYHSQIIFLIEDTNVIFDCFVIQPYFLIRKQAYLKDFKMFMELFDKMITSIDFLMLRKSGIKAIVNVSQIMYIEANQHQLEITTTDGIYVDSRLLKNMLSQIEKKGAFVQIHRSYVINLAFIKIIYRSEIEMVNQKLLPIGKKYEKQFNLALENYLNERKERRH